MKNRSLRTKEPRMEEGKGEEIAQTRKGDDAAAWEGQTGSTDW